LVNGHQSLEFEFVATLAVMPATKRASLFYGVEACKKSAIDSTGAPFFCIFSPVFYKDFNYG
jgi:hypothetical protein